MSEMTIVQTLASPPTPSPTVTLSKKAAERILLIASTDGSAPILRLLVEGGGCSGFQYKFDLVDVVAADDIAVERSGATLVVDMISLPYLLGAEVDFVDDLMGQAFRITNPNATASCGCGTSFAL
jgi:iron-sulfur cluster assembly accessory protein